MAKKALGRGLNAIFRTEGKEGGYGWDQPALDPETGDGEQKIDVGEKPATSVTKRAGTSEPEMDDVSRETSVVNISFVEPNHKQPRKQFDETKLEELADSIRRYGVLQPILVQKKGRLYEIIAGERRWRAAKLAGLTEIPIIEKQFAGQEAAEIAIIENIQREDLNPVEEARAYQTLIRDYGLKQDELAERVSKNRTTITNSLRLLQLSDKVLSELEAGRLSAGHARCLIGITDSKQQEALAGEILNKKLSVRETEKLVKQAGKKGRKKEAERKEQELDMYLVDLARSLTTSLNMKVLIRQGVKGHGKIEIDYYSVDDLEQIAAKLRQNV